MRLQRFLFLLIGFGIGFAGLYTWTKQRAPDVVRATPLPVDPHVPTDLGNSGGASQPPTPPVDAARLQELTQKIKQNPQDFDSFVELANMNFDQRNFNEAISLYTKALEVRPDALNVRTDMGTAMFYQNRFDEAIAQFQQTLKQDPSNAQALFNMGVAMLHGKNDAEGALASWERLVATNPNHPQTAFVKEQIQKLEQERKQK
jgi:cytochrome c-type biogenesis protein CcmH/NrfG